MESSIEEILSRFLEKQVLNKNASDNTKTWCDPIVPTPVIPPLVAPDMTVFLQKKEEKK